MPDSLIVDSLYIFQDTVVVTLTDQKPETSQLTTNIVTIVLALVAAYIALYQVKSNVISNARISWMENLRNYIGEYIRLAMEIKMIKLNIQDEISETDTEKEKKELLQNRYSNYISFTNETDKLATLIILNLNKTEPKFIEIENLLSKLRENMNSLDFSIEKSKEMNTLLSDLTSKSRDIFQNEWKKSKRIFRI